MVREEIIEYMRQFDYTEENGCREIRLQTHIHSESIVRLFLVLFHDHKHNIFRDELHISLNFSKCISPTEYDFFSIFITFKEMRKL